MILIFYEMTAELAFPVGESISLGLLFALYFGSRFVILVTNDCIVDPRLPDDIELQKEIELMPYYMAMFGLFLVVSIVSIYFAWRSDPELVRYEFDSLDFLEDTQENGTQEDTQEGATEDQDKEEVQY